jgi:hypothetical protein
VAYLLRAGSGLALFFGGIVVFNLQLQELLDIGTCASGNVPFDVRQGYECPEGTGTKILLLMGSVVGALIGGALFAFRGEPPWGGGSRRWVGMFGHGMLAWGLFFAGTGAALLIGQPYGESVDPATGEVVGRPDSQLGSTIVGITFLVMGLPALLLGLWGTFKGLTGRDERPSPSAGSAGGGMLSRMRAGLESAEQAQAIGARMPWGSGGSGGGASSADAIGKLERLQKLKESGAINQSEFEREKAKILGE